MHVFLTNLYDVTIGYEWLYIFKGKWKLVYQFVKRNHISFTRDRAPVPISKNVLQKFWGGKDKKVLK